MDTNNEPTALDLAPRWLSNLLTIGIVVIAAAGVAVGVLIVNTFSVPNWLAALLYIVGGAAFAALFLILYVGIVERTIGAKYRRERGIQS